MLRLRALLSYVFCTFILVNFLLFACTLIFFEKQHIDPSSDISLQTVEQHYRLSRVPRSLPRSSVQYTPSSPIVINGNSDFLEKVALHGWNGTGTSEDPIIIANYNITSSPWMMLEHLVVIENTNLYFCLQNNLLIGSTGTASTIGIYVNNVTTPPGFMADNNTILNNEIGIKVTNCAYSLITNNIIINNDQGIITDFFKYSLIIQNVIANNTGVGISLQNTSQHNSLFNNIISTNQIGVECKDKYVRHNFLLGNGFYENDIGLSIHDSEFIQVYGNDFIGNSPSLINSQAYDTGSENIFKNNYWADWASLDVNADGIVDVLYPIDGNANNADLSPQIAQNNPFSREIPISPTLRVLANDSQWMQYGLILFITLSLLVGISGIVWVKVLLPRTRVWFTRFSTPSSSDPSLTAGSQPDDHLHMILKNTLFAGVGCYLLAAESTLVLIFIASASQITGYFTEDLVTLFFKMVIYPFMHPWTLSVLYSARVNSPIEIPVGLELLYIGFVGIHIIVTILMIIIQVRILQPAIRKRREKETIDRIIPTTKILDDYTQKVLDYVRKDQDEDMG
ncbi:MAG: nitrous oxide reductase family maturation protein NosD [Promethearchaeota archaeon]